MNKVIKTIGNINEGSVSAHTKLTLVKAFSLLDNMSKSDEKMVKKVVEILGYQKINKENKDLLISYKQTLIDLIKKNKDTFNKKVVEEDESECEDIENDEDNNEQVEEEDENDEQEEGKSADEVEKMLDKKVAQYNGFSMNKPMKGVSFDKSKDKFDVRINKERKKFSKLNAACEFAKEQLLGKNRILISNVAPYYFEYQGHYFMIYWHNNDPLFDIHHIILSLNLKVACAAKKYNAFKDEVTHCHWHKNKFGGYILRELVNEETLYNIILSSESKISKAFKKDVSKILAELRKNGEIEITKTQVRTKKHRRVLKDPHKPKVNDDNELLEMIKEESKCEFYCYDKLSDVIKLKKMIKEGSKIPLFKYADTPVIYLVLITLKRLHKYVVVKVGYTVDIIDRLRTLKKEYNANVFLLDIKCIKHEGVEEHFHKKYYDIHPDHIEPLIIGKTNKEELYKLNDQLITEFNNVKSISPPDDIEKPSTEEYKSIEETLATQYKEFLETALTLIDEDTALYETIVNQIHDETMHQNAIELEKEKQKTATIQEEAKQMTIKVQEEERRKTLQLKIKYVNAKKKFANDSDSD